MSIVPRLWNNFALKGDRNFAPIVSQRFSTTKLFYDLSLFSLIKIFIFIFAYAT